MSSTCQTLPLSDGLRQGLEGLAGEVSSACRRDDLGALALLSYCEIRRWARSAGEQRLAQLSCALIAEHTAGDRKEFLAQVDNVIAEFELVCRRAGVGTGSSDRALLSSR